MWWWTAGWWWPGLAVMAVFMVICMVLMARMMGSILFRAVLEAPELKLTTDQQVSQLDPDQIRREGLNGAPVFSTRPRCTTSSGCRSIAFS
jgi:hypothetical protein